MANPKPPWKLIFAVGSAILKFAKDDFTVPFLYPPRRVCEC
jgi:hypothetical protein